MAQKGQDSTPKRVFWTPNKKNTPMQVTTWGYNSVLIGLKVDKGITGGWISFEGYLGMTPLEDPEAKWGDWYTLEAEVVKNKGEFLRQYDLTEGSTAFRIDLTGFSQFRCGLLEPLDGEGDVQVAYSCHAFN